MSLRNRMLAPPLALLGAAAMSLTVLPSAAFADHTEVTPESEAEDDGLVTSVRWNGGTRYDTASKLAVEGTEAAISTPATSAILATGQNFPDALAGSYLSGVVGGPILLTEESRLPDATRDRLTSDEPSGLREVDTIYVLGGPDAVDQAVIDEVEDLGDYEVVVFEGATRRETAAEIATEAPDGTVGEVDGMRTAIVARADNYPDALVAGAAARNASLPLLLTDTDELPEVTADALAELEIEKVLLPGGEVAVSSEVEAELTELGYEVERFDGGTRRDTANLIAEYNAETLGFSRDEIVLARGDNFPDALTVAPFAGREAISIVLSEDPNMLGNETEQYLLSQASCTFDTLYIPGGPDAVSDAVEADAREALTTDEDCAAVDNEAPTLTSAVRTGDEVIAIFDEPVTGGDTVPQQFRFVADDGAEVEASSVEFTDTDEVVVDFPSGSLDGGSLRYLQAGDPEARVRDDADNAAVNDVTVDLGAEFTVNTTNDAVDADPGDGVCETETAGECTLRAAVQEANADDVADVVTIEPGDYALTIQGADEDAAATGDLDVTSSVILRGTDATTTVVDAEAITDRAFDVLDGDVALTGVTVQNGELTDEAARGGAIRVSETSSGIGDTDTTFRLADAVVQDSTAPQAGGGLENTGADVTITDTDFSGNTTGTTPGNGGALHAAGGTTDVTGGTVSANEAVEGGGFWIGGGGELSVDGTTFEGNTATVVTDDESDTGLKGGGAIFNDAATLVVLDATFTDNDATAGNGSGGAVMTVGSEDAEVTTTITSSAFAGNLANRAGGVIENDTLVDDLTVTDSTFRDNVALGDGEGAPGNGGAIHTVSDAAVTGGAAEANTADEGGAFWVGGGATLTVADTAFSSNVAEGGPLVVNGGGALFNIASTLDVRSATFTDNVAFANAGSGGAIMTTVGEGTTATTTVSDSTFDGNMADRAGGAIESAGADTTIEASDFTANGAAGSAATMGAGNGGAVHDGGGTMAVTDSTFEQNTAVEGGALWSSGRLDVQDSTLVGNGASAEGASVYGQGTATLVLAGVEVSGAPVETVPPQADNLVFVEADVTVDATAGDNVIDDGGALVTPRPTCNREIGTTANGNRDDDGTCFADPGR